MASRRLISRLLEQVRSKTPEQLEAEMWQIAYRRFGKRLMGAEYVAPNTVTVVQVVHLHSAPTVRTASMPDQHLHRNAETCTVVHDAHSEACILSTGESFDLVA